MAGNGHAEKQQMYADPPASAEHHDLSRAEHLGKYAGRPPAECREQAVYGDQQRCLGRGESLIHHELGQEGEFETITGHENRDGQKAEHQYTRNAEMLKHPNHLQ